MRCLFGLVPRLSPPRNWVVSDDERLALPMAARHPGELLERRLGDVVDGDDAGVVHHLVQDHHVIRGLEDHHVVVVRARRHRRAGVEAHDAPVHEAAVLVRVVHVLAAIGRSLTPRLDGFRGPGRKPPVGRIDDERGPLVVGEVDAPLVPELVVRQHAALRARRVPRIRRARDGVEEVAVLPRALRRLERGGGLRVQGLLLRELPGALQRRQRPEREESRRCPGRRAGGASARRTGPAPAHRAPGPTRI